MDDAITHLATARHGLFSTEQAEAVGLDHLALGRAQRAGLIRRVMRGVYVARARDPRVVLAESAEHERTRAEHRLLCTAALYWYRDAALSHDSALVAHGLPVPDLHPTHAHLLRPVTRQVRTRNLTIDPSTRPVVRSPGGPAVPIAVGIMQLARARGVLAAVPAADEALHQHRVRFEDLVADAEQTAGWPGSGRAVALLGMVDGAAESVAESLARVHLRLAGYRLESQVEVIDAAGSLVGRIDLRIAGSMVGIEVDGKQKYASGDPQVLWAEKRREDRLRRCGWSIVRVTWAEIHDPERMLRLIEEATRGALHPPAA